MRYYASALWLLLCGHGTPTRAEPPPASRTTERKLPQYPGVVVAGLLGGPEPEELFLSTDSVEKVRTFYVKQTYAGWKLERGVLTEASPLCVTDTTHNRRHCIWVESSQDVTLIHVRTRR